MTLNDQSSRLRALLVTVDGLPDSDVEAISVLIDAGEDVIALETLATQIYEYDIELVEPKLTELFNLGTMLNVRVGYLLGESCGEISSDG